MVLTTVTARLGFIMHTGNHMGISSTVWLNRLAGYMMDLIGSSHLIWQHEHQVAHHCDPNVVGHDNDCSIGDPYLRFHPDIKRKWWHKYQHILTFVGMSVGFFKWLFGDFFCFFDGKVGSAKFAVSTRDWIKLVAFKFSWIYLHMFLPYQLHGALVGTTILFLTMIPGAHYLENIFIVNHIQADLIPPPNSHWAVKQVLATSNWASGSHFWNFVSGGLNHQIEHHLFPCYSIYVYPEISSIVQQTCQEFNLPYTNFAGFSDAWLHMFFYLRDLGTDKFDAHRGDTLKVQ